MSKSNAKAKLKSFGNGFLAVASVVADTSTMTRMSEIETEIDKLQEEYAQLNERLVSGHRRQTPYIKK